MFSTHKSKELYDRSGLRSYCAQLAVAFLIIILNLHCCMHKPDYLKFSIADGESIVIKKSYVKYVNVESDDMGYSRAAVIYFTEKGDEEIYKVLARNIGKFISLYYGDKLIRGNVKIMEAYKLGRIGVLIENEKDEALVIDIMRTYKERKGAGQ